MKSLGVYYCCVKIPQCGYMEHGLKDVAFYVKKHIAPWAIYHNPQLVQEMPLGAPAFVRLVYSQLISVKEASGVWTLNVCQSISICNADHPK